jgi:hypothetical protein
MANDQIPMVGAARRAAFQENNKMIKQRASVIGHWALVIGH